MTRPLRQSAVNADAGVAYAPALAERFDKHAQHPGIERHQVNGALRVGHAFAQIAGPQQH